MNGKSYTYAYSLKKHITNIVMVYSLNKITQSNNFLKLSVKLYDFKEVIIWLKSWR